MDDQKVQKLLEQLQEELRHADSADQQAKDLLQEIEKDVSELLNRRGDDAEPVHPNVIERFESTIDLLELTHPRLTSYMAELLEILSKAGI